MFLDNWFIESGSFFKLVVLHEQHVGNVQFPRFVFIAKLHALAEYSFHLVVIMRIVYNKVKIYESVSLTD